MARKLYSGYGITELRGYAREYKIAGRSKMDGYQLAAAVNAVWRQRVIDVERAVLAAVKVEPGTLLRHKSTGTVVRATSTPAPYIRDGVNYESLAFTAEYVTVSGRELIGGGWIGRGADYARHLNERHARSAANGYTVQHMLYQYGTMEA